MTLGGTMRGITVNLVVLGLLVGATPAASQTTLAFEPAADSNWWLATGLGAGAVNPDQSLANYRWDTSPAALYAFQATAGRGRFAAGLRFSRWATTQATGLTQTDPDPLVRLNTFELVGQFRLAEVAGFQFWASALAGRIGLSYEPDQVTIATGVPGEEITVQYQSLGERNLGLGLELKREIGGRMTAALQAERSSFHLDTSHRRGAEIISEREEFINWSFRLLVSWVLDLG